MPDLTDLLPDDDRRPSPPLKVAVLVRDDLPTWQRLNATVFLVSGLIAARPGLVGEVYRDASGADYLPMLGIPAMVHEGSAEMLRTVHARALSRGLGLTVFTSDLFRTGNDVDNRAAVAAVATTDLDLVGLGVVGPRNGVDKALKGARLHP